jgi:ParB family chromosome partitioning protein
MTLQTLTIAQIQPSILNPRKYFNDTTIEELAQSIKTDGLLQNLVVLKPGKSKKKHNIIAGERRFRAISHLIEKGELDKDFPIAVEIRENISEEEALRLATVENVQRENLAPLEEAEALQTLAHGGEKLDDIVSKTGLSVATIRRRLLLLGLSDNVKNALSERKITLSQAEALTMGSAEYQEDILDDLMNGQSLSASDIKERLTDNLPALSMAIFPKEQYTGDFTKDLLAEDNMTYFNDVDQFFELQKQAAENLVADYAQTHDFAELEEGYSFHSWNYGKAREGEKGGVIVFFSNNGEVTIHEGLTKKAVHASTACVISEKAKDTYPAPLRRYMGMHKSLALQAAILGNPRKAKELAVCRKLARFKAHECLPYFEQLQDAPPALLVLNQESEILLSDLKIDVDGETPLWRLLGSSFNHDEEAAYDAIQSLTDEQLEAILLFLEVCEFGQDTGDRLDINGDSLFNKIAVDLAIDMRDYWRPDEGFLKRRNKVQLQALMNESGASAKLASAASYKKGELVKSLVKFFTTAKSVSNPTETDQSANAWLPEAMQFPAINPDASAEPDEEDFDSESDFENDDDYAQAA